MKKKMWEETEFRKASNDLSEAASDAPDVQEEDATIRTYKDTVFRLLFNNREKMLELYNALYDTNYPPETPVDINTIQEALHLQENNRKAPAWSPA